MATSPTDIKLGNVVRHLITGFIGTTTYRADHLTGTIQFHVQPKCTDPSVMPEGTMFDWQSLEVIDPGVAGLYTPADESDCTVELGREYVNKFNNFKGFAKVKFVSINGCIQICLESRMKDNSSDDRKTGFMQGEFDHKELELIPDSVAPKVEASPGGCIRGSRKSTNLR